MKDILEIIKSQGRGISLEELCELTNMEKSDIMPLIEEYMSSFDLVFVKGKYALPKQMGLYVGKISCHIKGFAFLLQKDEDIFIPSGDVGYAMDGDIVAVRLKSGASRGHSREGYVADVITRSTHNIIGTVEKIAGKYRLNPKNKKLQYDIIIDNLGDAVSGDVVTAAITRYPGKKSGLVVNVTKVLGQEGDAGIDIECAIAGFAIPNQFKKSTLREAKEIPQKVSEPQERLDLRKEITITIDGDDSRDFDDAVSLEMKDDHYILKVHIADVSHYVKAGSALDKEAYLRGNSVYFPGSVIPMLPKELSNGICSLNEGVDRYALSCIMRVDFNGRVFEDRIIKTIINSNHRMTYANVNRILAGDRNVREQYADIVPMIEHMNELRQLLFNNRLRAGSLEFDIPEAGFILDDTDKVKDVVLRERGNSERIIEEFMLLANKTVCEYMINSGLPCVYRVHELPSADKLDIFSAFVGAFGYKLDKQNITPKKMQRLLDKVKGQPIETAVSIIMLRTLQKARYSSVNQHHFGLAFQNYCHFTSPIRRYADLMIHRIISDYLEGKVTPIHDLEGICSHISETEKTAMEAEMKVNDLYKCHYLKDFIGCEYEGIISGMNNSGFYVMLPNTCEGMVRLAEIKGDYFVFNERLFHVMGEHTRRIFRMGDKVTVVISRVNEALCQVDMSLVSN